MCTLEDVKRQNEKEHSEMTRKLSELEPKINAASMISTTTKWVAGGLLSIIVVLLGLISFYSGMTYKATKHAADVEISSFKRLNVLQDTIAVHWEIETRRYVNEIKPQREWTRKVANDYIMPAFNMAKENKTEIKVIKKRIGL